MTITRSLRRSLWGLGYDVSAFRPATNVLARRQRLLEQYGVNIVLDVGANTGQFAIELRRDLKFTGQIISFEPQSAAFEALQEETREDPAWTAVRIALGDRNETRAINIAGNSQSSSFLDMLQRHRDCVPTSAYSGREVVEVRTLDSFIDAVFHPGANIYLKIDTQGYEDKVLDGAEQALRRIDTIQLELSLCRLYEGEVLFREMWDRLEGEGYHLVAVEPGFSDPDTSELLQLDGIFHRS